MAERNDAFISYSRKDKEFIKILAGALDKHEITYWVDWEGIPLASDWWKEIQEGIENADSFIFVISEDSVTSDVCRKEIDHAVADHKRIIPVLWKEIKDKEAFKNMHPSISSHNWIFMDEGKDLVEATQALLDTLQADPDHIKEHTRLLIRAKDWENDEHENSKLLGGADVTEAEQWLATASNKDPAPAQLHHEFVLESRQRQRTIQRRILTGVSIALAISVVLTILSVFLYREAEISRAAALIAKAEAERNAQEALSLALSAGSQLALLANNEIDLAVALAVAANDIDEAPIQVERVLADAVYSPGTRFLLGDATDNINTVAFNPDGTQALVASEDGDIRIYNTETAQLVGDLKTEGHPLDVATFSHDGTHIAMGDCAEVETSDAGDNVCIAGDVVVYDVESGDILQTLSGHTTDVVSVAFSPDDTMIISGSTDETARVWNVETGEELHMFDNHNGGVVAVDMHPTEPIALTYAIQTAPITWNLETGEMIEEFTQHQVTGEPNLVVGAAVFSPDGQNILSSYGIDLRLWDYATGEITRQYRNGHTSFINSVSFDEQGEQFVSSAWRENGFLLWNSIHEEPAFRFDAHDDIVTSVAISPNSHYAVTGSQDDTARLWELTNGASIQQFVGSTDDIFSVAVHPDGDVIASAGYDDMVRIWDIETGDNTAVYEGATDDLWIVVYSPDGSLMASGGKDNIIRVMDAGSGEILQELDGHSNWITTLAFSHDSSKLASGSNDLSVIIWDVESGEPIECYFGEECIGDTDGQLRSVLFNADDSQLLVGANTARLIDLETGYVLQKFEGHTNRINTVAFSPDESQVLTGSADGNIRLWDIESGVTHLIFSGHIGQVRSVTFDPNGSHILSSSADGTVRLWNPKTGLEFRRYTAHSEWVNQAVYSADGESVFSASWDDTLIQWHIHDTVEELDGWSQNNRYIRDLTCNEERVYLVNSPTTCE